MLVIISGLSGSGKSFLIDLILECFPEFNFLPIDANRISKANSLDDLDLDPRRNYLVHYDFSFPYNNGFNGFQEDIGLQIVLDTVSHLKLDTKCLILNPPIKCHLERYDSRAVSRTSSKGIFSRLNRQFRIFSRIVRGKNRKKTIHDNYKSKVWRDAILLDWLNFLDSQNITASVCNLTDKNKLMIFLADYFLSRSP